MDELVEALVIENRLPFRFVGSSSFKRLIESLLPPNRSLMSDKTLKARVRSRLLRMKEILKKELADVSSVCTTADAWKCRGK